MVCNYSDGVQKEDLFLMGVLTNAADQHFLCSHMYIYMYTSRSIVSTLRAQSRCTTQQHTLFT
jgi:hypothetical protein